MISGMESTTYRREEDKEPDDLDDLLDSIMMEEEKGRNIIQKTALRIVNIVDYPFERMRQKAYESYIWRLTNCDGFREFEEKLKPYTGTLSMDDYKSTTSYISALLILDQLDSSLTETGTKLPDKVQALDVGCGKDWFYAKALYGFLQNYGAGQPREVKLDGIDPLLTSRIIAKFKKGIGDKEIDLTQGDILKMDAESQYNFILIHKMLTSPGHFERFGLEPINMDDMMEKCSHLLTPDGIQVTIGYQSAGEYWHVVEHIPTDRRIAEFDYAVELGNKDLNFAFTPGMDRMYRSGICLSRKQ